MADPTDSSPAWPTRSVFVTGAYGLLGGWLVKALVQRGAQVTVLERDGVSASALVREGTERLVNVVHGDVCDGSVLERALGEYEIDTVFHLAAQTIVGVANRGPAATFETNIRGTWLMLEACRHAGVARTIVASSDKAYGAQDDLPYTESSPLAPVHPYDVSKAAADLLARSYWHTFGLPVAVTRCANLYGGGDFNLSRLIPEAVLAALEGRSPVIRSDGSPERDFLYVEDAVAAYLAVSDLLDEGHGAGEAYNAGSGAPRSVLEVVELVCALAGTGLSPEVRGTSTPEGEIARQWVDCAKLRAGTGWEPHVALEQGLRHTIAWYREHRGAAGRAQSPPAPADHRG